MNEHIHMRHMQKLKRKLPHYVRCIKSGKMQRDRLPPGKWHNNYVHRFLTLGDIGRRFSVVWLPVLVVCFVISYSMALYHAWSDYYETIVIAAIAVACLDITIIYIARWHRRTSGAVLTQFLIMQLPRVVLVLMAAFALVANTYQNNFSHEIVKVWTLGITMGLQLMGSLLYFRGMYVEVAGVEIVNQILQSTKIRSALRIVHLSDLHIEKLSIREDVWIAELQKDPPDLIVLTGDYLNLSNVHDHESQRILVQCLQALPASVPRIAVPGSPTVDPRMQTQRLLEEAGCLVLRDEIVQIVVGDQTIQIIGLDCDHHAIRDDTLLEDRIKSCVPELFTILLFHSPEIMPLACHMPIDLYLCGHTHGGQVRIPIVGALMTASRTGRAYINGRYEKNNTVLYVSRGIGLEGQAAPRMRLLCQPELIYWQLNKAT